MPNAIIANKHPVILLNKPQLERKTGVWKPPYISGKQEHRSFETALQIIQSFFKKKRYSQLGWPFVPLVTDAMDSLR